MHGDGKNGHCTENFPLPAKVIVGKHTYLAQLLCIKMSESALRTKYIQIVAFAQDFENSNKPDHVLLLLVVVWTWYEIIEVQLINQESRPTLWRYLGSR